MEDRIGKINQELANLITKLMNAREYKRKAEVDYEDREHALANALRKKNDTTKRVTELECEIVAKYKELEDVQKDS